MYIAPQMFYHTHHDKAPKATEKHALCMLQDRMPDVESDVLVFLMRAANGQMPGFLGQGASLRTEYADKVCASTHAQRLNDMEDGVQTLLSAKPCAMADMIKTFSCKYDGYVSADMADMLSNPDVASGVYPDRSLYTCQQFVNMVAFLAPQCAPKQALYKLDSAHTRPWAERKANITVLQQLEIATNMADVLAQISTSARTSKNANLAAMANCLARRANAVAQDIVYVTKMAVQPNPMGHNSAANQQVLALAS